ncbi:type VI secretion system baseplate subunit TssF [Paracoccus saliphilus]|uniref:Type VI secretion system baseplate subunit TssF n=1 Tax=Paracoccus saliphilus TaxID=405559 RepID=A0AA45W1J0_9RHOB|nr:type VI secretion system baseplate subunit TssF [Paracoccus saliphilus]WCR03643.1 type VI secretion system baseplate subunit TssF [Paracoccus saliphilus]SIS57159.1 type VI secretion system protein ImpG [Paracoccus saliphilus]
MKKAFRDAYERELDILYERSAEFADEFPGLADRLGGVLRENIDPTIAGLLEGTAFLAARVQLKLDEEFRGFTTELLEQIFPDALSPIPSCMMVQAPATTKDSGDPSVRRYNRNTYLDASFRDADNRVTCRFSTTAPMTVLPLRLTGLTYHDRTTALGGLGQDPDRATRAGLQMDIESTNEQPISALGEDALTFHLTGDMFRAIALYEQIHCNVTRISLRWLRPNGDPCFFRLHPDQIDQIGFTTDELLLDRQSNLFEGFALLRDFYAFPRKFLGFRLTGLTDILRNVATGQMQVIFEFDRVDDDLARLTQIGDIRLNCAPAINLFEEGSNQIRLDDKRHEYVVMPDSGPMSHYEVHRLLQVYATYGTAHERVDVEPLYALPQGATSQRSTYYYTSRRKPRRMTESERRHGMRSGYRGTETYVSIYEPPESVIGDRAHRLHLRTLCSNRHLPSALPLVRSEDFNVVSDRQMSVSCINGPTAPREAMTETERAGPHRTGQGDVYWRLISYLALNHFGLDDRYGRDGAASLREILTLFADLSDSVTEAQIAAVVGLNVRPITRSLRRAEGYFPARGLEISVTFDETGFEGSGIILMAAVLDRFFAEYVSINSFTQMVTVSKQRGVIRKWPPRTGTGPLI